MSSHAVKSPADGSSDALCLWTMALPEDDPEIRKRAIRVNAWSNDILKLLTGVQPIEGLSLEEASLMCALGLPGAEDLDMTSSLNTFAEWGASCWDEHRTLAADVL